MVRCVALMLMLFCIGWGGRVHAERPRGSLMIIGGALKADTGEVWSRIVELAGGPGAPIAVFGAASDDPVGSSEAVVATLQRYGARPYFVPVATELAGSDYRRAAADAGNVALVSGARGVYFTGGDQARITRALLGPDGGRTQVLDAVWGVFERGGVIAGSSAGAAVMSRVMFNDPAPTLELLTRGAMQGSDVAPGLGFVGPQLFVDQHVLARGRFARMVPAMVAAGYRVGLGIDENTAAEVSPDGRVAIIGRSGAVSIGLGDAMCTSTATGLRVSNARIGLLRPGDAYDPSSGDVTPAPGKHPFDGRAASTPERRVIEYPDILAPGALVALIDELMESGLPHAVGRASGPRSTFVFDFRTTGESRAYATAGFVRGTAAGTATDVMFDIEPLSRRGREVAAARRPVRCDALVAARGSFRY